MISVIVFGWTETERNAGIKREQIVRMAIGEEYGIPGESGPDRKGMEECSSTIQIIVKIRESERVCRL